MGATRAIVGSGFNHLLHFFEGFSTVVALALVCKIAPLMSS